MELFIIKTHLDIKGILDHFKLKKISSIIKRIQRYKKRCLLAIKYQKLKLITKHKRYYIKMVLT